MFRPAFAAWTEAERASFAIFLLTRIAVVGVAAAAPATYLAALFEIDKNTSSGRSLSAMALHSWSVFFKLPLDGVVEPSAFDAFQALASDCIQSIENFIKEDDDEKRLERHAFLIGHPTTLPPLAGHHGSQHAESIRVI